MFFIAPSPHKSLSLTLTVLACLPYAAVADDILYDGTVDGNGNTTAGVNSNVTVENIHVVAHGKPNLADRGFLATYTTEALIANKGATLKATGDIHVVNTSQNGGGDHDIDNNGAIYALNGSTIDFNGATSVYLASIGGEQGFNDDTAISAKQNFSSQEKNAINRVEIKNVEGPVQIIGSLDVSPSISQAWDPENYLSDNKIVVELSGDDSFWYGSAIGEGEGREVHVTLSDGASTTFVK